MRIDGTAPIPTFPAERQELPQKADTRPVQSVRQPEAKQQSARVDSTNVVVELQGSGTYVYKFVDSATGQVIEQIPSQQLIGLANAIRDALSALMKSQGEK